MKSRFIVALLPLSFLVASCGFLNCVRGEGEIASRKRSPDDVGGFMSIQVDGDVKVVVAQGPPSIVVMAQENIIPHVVTVSQEYTLKIGLDRCVTGSLPVTVHVTHPALRGVRVTGSGSVVAAAPLDLAGAGLLLQVDGSGSISLPIEKANTRSVVNGSGSISLQGNVKHHAIEINGSGNVDAYALQTETTEVALNGSGECRVSASALLSGSLAGSGNILYRGAPRVDVARGGSGRIVGEEVH